MQDNLNQNVSILVSYQESTLFLVDLRQLGDLGEPRVVLRDERFIGQNSSSHREVYNSWLD